jgi:peptidoglycan/LPS O-acetylase OafA/YrhL
LPFIDGLRFFTLLSVALVHFVDFYEVHTYPIRSHPLYQQLHLDAVAGYSDNCVLVFFAISGFVLGMPFAKAFFTGEKRPNLKSFYLRRVMRLEPPYIIILTGLLLMNVYIFHKSSLMEVLPNYFASLFYLHNIIFESHPVLNFVFWTLEIEVQFYLIAPFLSQVFRLPAISRRVLLCSLMVGFSTLNYFFSSPFLSLYNFFQYFMAGFLAVDIFLNYKGKKKYLFDAPAIVLFLLIWTGVFKYGFEMPFLICFLIVFSSRSIIWDGLLTLKWISIIGGMCYTIYMLHHPVIAAFLNRVAGNDQWFTDPILDFSLKIVITMCVVFLISAIYFILVERPCMKKGWHKELGKKLSPILRIPR